MTEEKAIRLLTTKRAQPSTDYQMAEVYTMAIQALSQEPCDDAVSREAVYQLLMNMASSAYGFEEIRRIVDKLPPVMQKSGKWIKSLDYIGNVKCSICQKEYDQDVLYDAKYCPNCGAKMKREDKE